ncbi:Zn-ribbon domain-containing OB-fold protein [Candidatus Hecatella orcuttiae]|jgi:hypothetical protein|uniref:Zn-ribbon domain-containing OB-fold protein n=1 Tax=Candidatus Hecatella orcuttiae TaxID=1935119 RepID=UPI002867C727|nr:Zn-ribbon domain-containing OB-fold protein [Candidatus Hecatella orcuttiae]
MGAVSEFWDKLKGEKKLFALKCRCGAVVFPPQPSCPTCNGWEMEWVELSGRGEIYAYTVSNIAPPSFTGKLPFCVSIIKLEEGPMVMSIVETDRPEIGMKVQMVLEEKRNLDIPDENWRERPLYKFKPIPAGDSA